MDNKEKAKETVQQFTEEIEVAGREMVSTVKQLLNDASVHRVKVVNKSSGEVVLDIPAAAGAGAALFLAPWVLLGVGALYLMNFTVVVERHGSPDEGVVEDIVVEEKEDVADLQEDVADVVAQADAVAEEIEAVSAEISDTIDAMTEQAEDAVDAAVEEIEVVAESAAEEVVEAVAPDRCQGTTKAGAQCKRKPTTGSAYCSAHQPE